MLKYTTCYRDLSYLGIPIIIGQIGTIVMSFTDTLMIGHHSTPELAAASFVNNMFTLVIILALGFSYSITPTVGSHYGREEYQRIGQVLKNGIAGNMALALLLVGVMALLYWNLGNLGQPEELLPLMRPYFLVQLVSLPFVCFANAFKQFYDGITNTRTPMYILLIGNVLNIIGNWILIYGKLGLPEMGLLGAGLSTLVARIFVAFAFVWVFVISRRYQIMLTISQLGFMIYYGFGAAVAIKVSLCVGLRNYDDAGRYSHAGFHLAMMCATAVTIPIVIFRDSLGILFTDNVEVCQLVSALVLPFVIYQVGDCLQCAYSNGLRGLSVVKPLVPVAFFAYFVVSLPIGYLLGLPLGLGLEGVWFAFPAGLTTAGICYLYFFRRNQKRLASN